MSDWSAWARARRSRVSVLALGAAVALAGCQSASGVRDDGVGGPANPASLPEPAIGSDEDAWSGSDEYAANIGLGLINASQGYAARTNGLPGGQGVRIAIVDSGVDNDHDDLDSRNFSFTGDIPETVDVHGTHVAGIAAARRNGQGMHGVAYNADVISIKALRTFDVVDGVALPIGSDSDELSLALLSAAGLDRDVWNTVQIAEDTAVVIEVDDDTPDIRNFKISSNGSAQADIINMSLGGPDPAHVLDENGNDVDGFPVLDAMRDAAVRNKIMVAALGNDGIAGASAAPAQYVDDPRMRGLAIAVGALDEAGTAAAEFSNSCGGLQQCIFAPGENIFATFPGDDYGELSGTSMAAPHGGAVRWRCSWPPSPTSRRARWSPASSLPPRIWTTPSASAPASSISPPPWRRWAP